MGGPTKADMVLRQGIRHAMSLKAQAVFDELVATGQVSMHGVAEVLVMIIIQHTFSNKNRDYRLTLTAAKELAKVLSVLPAERPEDLDLDLPDELLDRFRVIAGGIDDDDGDDLSA